MQRSDESGTGSPVLQHMTY